MSERRIVVTINPDGTIAAETVGITGKACLDYLPVLEDLLDAEAVSSEFTADYTATEVGEDVSSAASETVGEHRSS